MLGEQLRINRRFLCQFFKVLGKTIAAVTGGRVWLDGERAVPVQRLFDDFPSWLGTAMTRSLAGPDAVPLTAQERSLAWLSD